MREKMNVRKLFRMTAFIRASREIVCHLNGWVVFDADGRDHCIIGETLAPCVDVVVDHRSATPRNFAQTLQTGLLPLCDSQAAFLLAEDWRNEMKSGTQLGSNTGQKPRRMGLSTSRQSVGLGHRAPTVTYKKALDSISVADVSVADIVCLPPTAFRMTCNTCSR